MNNVNTGESKSAKGKHILFFLRHYFDLWGGIEEHVFNISSQLSLRHSVTITTPLVDTTHRAYLSTISYVPHRATNISSYDVIFLENFELLPHFILCLKIMLTRHKHRPKVILVPHGGFTLRWSVFSLPARVIKFLYNKIFGLYFINRYCDLCIAVSNWEEEALRNEGITIPISVIRNGYEDEYKNVSAQKQNYFIFVGRIQPIKNIENVILTFKQLCGSSYFDGFTLKIIGDYTANKDYFAKLSRLISDNNLNDRVIFLGSKFGKEKYQLIADARCLFCLSLWENDPVVIKEALSMNTKVIIEPTYGLMDYIKEKNVFVNTQDKLDPLIFSAFLNSEFETNLEIPIFSWAAIARKYEELYAQ